MLSIGPQNRARATDSNNEILRSVYSSPSFGLFPIFFFYNRSVFGLTKNRLKTVSLFVRPKNVYRFCSFRSRSTCYHPAYRFNSYTCKTNHLLDNTELVPAFPSEGLFAFDEEFEFVEKRTRGNFFFKIVIPYFTKLSDCARRTLVRVRYFPLIDVFDYVLYVRVVFCH